MPILFFANVRLSYSSSVYKKKQVNTPHLVAQKNLQNIAEIGPFGDDSDAHAFLWANLSKNLIF